MVSKHLKLNTSKKNRDKIIIKRIKGNNEKNKTDGKIDQKVRVNEVRQNK